MNLMHPSTSPSKFRVFISPWKRDSGASWSPSDTPKSPEVRSLGSARSSDGANSLTTQRHKQSHTLPLHPSLPMSHSLPTPLFFPSTNTLSVPYTYPHTRQACPKSLRFLSPSIVRDFPGSCGAPAKMVLKLVRHLVGAKTHANPQPSSTAGCKVTDEELEIAVGEVRYLLIPNHKVVSTRIPYL